MLVLIWCHSYSNSSVYNNMDLYGEPHQHTNKLRLIINRSKKCEINDIYLTFMKRSCGSQFFVMNSKFSTKGKFSGPCFLFWQLDKLCFCLIKFKTEKKTEAGESMTVYSCNNISDKRNLSRRCSTTLKATTTIKSMNMFINKSKMAIVGNLCDCCII